jgi:biopolymer transport protein ExbD
MMPKFVDHIRLPAIDSTVGLFDILNLLLLFAAFFSLNSRFILSPGLGVALSTVGVVEARKTIGVLTVQSEKLLMLDGDICSIDTLGRTVEKYRRAGGGTPTGTAILIRPDRSLPVGTLLKICEIVKAAGYETVQIAAATEKTGDD